MIKIVVLGNGNDWCKLSLTECSKKNNVKVINSPLPYDTDRFLSRICKLHYSQTIERYFNLPFKSIWFKYFANYMCENVNNKVIVLIYDRNRLANNAEFLNYLRKHYSHIKLVYMFTNIVKISGANNNNFIEKLNTYYDIVYAFDPADAPKYHFDYHPLLYSENRSNDSNIQNKVFYVGRAKDRFSMLMQVYDKLNTLGIKRDFFVFGVTEEQQVHANEITYNKLIPYTECLKRIQKASCLLDIIQGESQGFTIKVCEAVYYNKLLITTNVEIKKAPFYNKDWILVIQSVDDINVKFFENANMVDYSQKDREYFSALHFFDELEKLSG